MSDLVIHTTHYYRLPVSVINPSHDARHRYDKNKATWMFRAGHPVQIDVTVDNSQNNPVTTKTVYLTPTSAGVDCKSDLGRAILKALEGQPETEKTLGQALRGHDSDSILKALFSLEKITLKDVDAAIVLLDEPLPF